MNHSRIDERSLALGRLIAERLRQDPTLIDRARENLDRWAITSGPRTRATLQEWKEALDGPLEQVLGLLTSTDELSTRLRQSNPFAGVLSDAERNRVIREFQQHDSAAT